MPYKFTFDLSKVPRFFFTEIATVSYQKGMHKTLLNTLAGPHKEIQGSKKLLVLIFQTLLSLIQDLVDMQVVNLIGAQQVSGN